MKTTHNDTPRRTVWGRVAVLIVAVGALAGMWRYTPLQRLTDPARLQELVSLARDHWWTGLAVIPAYLAANSLMFPNMVLNAAVILTLGGAFGWGCAIAGSLTAASTAFFIGKRFGAGRFDVHRRKRFEKVRRFLRKGGIGAVVAVRMVPVAPYTVVNTAAGTIDLRFRDFFIGTFIAHLPGTLTLAVFGEQLEAALGDPSAKNLAVLAAVVLAGACLLWIIKRTVQRRIDKSS